MAEQVQQEPRERTFFGHPWGLTNLAGIEVWERLSFYGMQAILAYYLYFSVADGGLGYSKGSATSLVGAYGGLVYLAAVLGAWVADRLLGSERTLFYSGVLILIGHVALSTVPGLTGVAIGLVCVALGSGSLKSNTAAVLGTLYKDGDTRRDAGFSLFYMGINLGAFVGPLLTDFLRTRLGFHYGFGLAAIGMAIGLAQYAFGRKNIGAAGRAVPNPLPRSEVWRPVLIGVVIVAVIVLAFATGLLTLGNLSKVVTSVIVLGAVVLFAVLLTSKETTRTERSRVCGFIPLFAASFAFFALFQQIFTVIAIYAEERVDLNVGGFSIPPGWAQSVDPIGILLFAPLLAALWVKLGRRQPSSPMKFAMGLGGMGICFLLFLPMAGSTGHSNPVIFVGIVLLLFSIPELMLSPVGLSLSTKLAPAAFPNQMVALNYLSVAAGTSAAGTLAGLYSSDVEFGYFGIIGGIAVVLAVLLGAGSRGVRKLMRGVD